MAFANSIDHAKAQVPLYDELTCRSLYSFSESASRAAELPAAADFGYRALALTYANLCGALEFAQAANSLGVKPITGGTLTLADDTQLTLLARSRQGYANLSRLFTLANAAERRDHVCLPVRADELTALIGDRDGDLSRLLLKGDHSGARTLHPFIHRLVRRGQRIYRPASQLTRRRRATQPRAHRARRGARRTSRRRE